MPADRIRERGSAAVEFALLLPILLLLLLALVQVGVIARDSLVLTQASRAGARFDLPLPRCSSLLTAGGYSPWFSLLRRACAAASFSAATARSMAFSPRASPMFGVRS